ncbi:MAG TPA: hypothetical protein VHQ47_17780 [Phycisphaerae bacterium]|nr:hypothetical protein [Phycisphaerae bacterium]
MKVHRLIIIEDILTGRQVGACEDVVYLQNLIGEISADNVEILRAANDVRYDAGVAGLRIHGRLTPAHAANRQALLARKQEARK